MSAEANLKDALSSRLVKELRELMTTIKSNNIQAQIAIMFIDEADICFQLKQYDLAHTKMMFARMAMVKLQGKSCHS